MSHAASCVSNIQQWRRKHHMLGGATDDVSFFSFIKITQNNK